MAELDIFMQKYIHLVSTRCNCDKNVLTTLYQELLKESEPTTCTYKFLRGDNKGKYCGDVVFDNKLCKKHLKQQSTKEKIQGKKIENSPSTQKVESKKTQEITPTQKVESKKTQEVESKLTQEEITSTQNVYVELDPIVVHFDSKLNENMMHANKSLAEITKEYEKIIPTVSTVSTQQKIVKRRILPPSLRPTLKIGDKVTYNDGKKTCNGIVKKIIKDMAELDNTNDTKPFIGPMRYMLLQK